MHLDKCIALVLMLQRVSSIVDSISNKVLHSLLAYWLTVTSVRVSHHYMDSLPSMVAFHCLSSLPFIIALPCLLTKVV